MSVAKIVEGGVSSFKCVAAEGYAHDGMTGGEARV